MEFSQSSDGPRWKIALRQEMDRLYLEYMCPLQPSTPKGLMIPAPFSKQDLSPRSKPTCVRIVADYRNHKVPRRFFWGEIDQSGRLGHSQIPSQQHLYPSSTGGLHGCQKLLLEQHTSPTQSIFATRQTPHEKKFGQILLVDDRGHIYA
jgi:hypothetical protein